MALVAVTGSGTAAPRDPHWSGRVHVYVVVVDGLDGDRVDSGKAPFIASLLAGSDSRATYFRESRAQMIAETNPNHVAMATGAYTDRSGIVGNTFALYSDLEGEVDNEADSCTRTTPEDLSRLPTVTSGENEDCLQAETIFEAIKRQGNPERLVTAAVFGKRKLGQIFAGKNVRKRRRDVDHLWAPCGPNPSPEAQEYCADVPVDPVPTVMDRTLHDRIVMDEVIRTIREGVPVRGRMRRPDLTFVNLPQVDNAGHTTGTEETFGPPVDGEPFGELRYDQAIALADQQTQRLVEELQELDQWRRSVLILLSDHSTEGPQQRITLTDVFTEAGIPEDAFLIVDNGNVDSVYLADRTSAERFMLLREMREVSLTEEGIAEALYREPNRADGGRAHTIDGAHPEWRASSERSPDLLVTAESGYFFSDPSPTSNPFVGNHGAPHTRDNFLAVIGGSALVRHRALAGEVAPGFDDTRLNKNQAENVDVAATVMGLFGLFEPADNRGRFLRQAFNRRLLRQRARPARPPLRLQRRDDERLLLRWRPEGGSFDLQVRRQGAERWRRLLRDSERTSLRFRGEEGVHYRFRLRSRSAAGVPSRWRRHALKLG